MLDRYRVCSIVVVMIEARSLLRSSLGQSCPSPASEDGAGDGDDLGSAAAGGGGRVPCPSCCASS
jgi:hypothetical protein